MDIKGGSQLFRQQASSWPLFGLALRCRGQPNTGPLAALQRSPNAPSQDTLGNTDIRTVDTHMPLPEFSNLQAWEQRKKFLRNQILVSAGLSPMLEKTPLNAQIFGKIEEKDSQLMREGSDRDAAWVLPWQHIHWPRNGRAKHPEHLSTRRDIGSMAASKISPSTPRPPSASASPARDILCSLTTWSAITIRSNCHIVHRQRRAAPVVLRSAWTAGCGIPSVRSTSSCDIARRR